MAAFLIVEASDSLRGREPSCSIFQYYLIIHGSKGALCLIWHPVELLVSLEMKSHQAHGVGLFHPDGHL